jgi:hypothetical protein
MFRNLITAALLAAFAVGLCGWSGVQAGDGKLDIQMPLGRTAYQTNEWVQLAVVPRRCRQTNCRSRSAPPTAAR